jgi:hypothetical protein
MRLAYGPSICGICKQQPEKRSFEEVMSCGHSWKELIAPYINADAPPPSPNKSDEA